MEPPVERMLAGALPVVGAIFKRELTIMTYEREITS